MDYVKHIEPTEKQNVYARKRLPEERHGINPAGTRGINVDATWRCIGVDAMSYKRHDVPTMLMRCYINVMPCNDVNVSLYGRLFVASKLMRRYLNAMTLQKR